MYEELLTNKSLTYKREQENSEKYRSSKCRKHLLLLGLKVNEEGKKVRIWKSSPPSAQD